ncbi:hypothetical protein FKM82_025585 [Ascaphus truei]
MYFVHTALCSSDQDRGCGAASRTFSTGSTWQNCPREKSRWHSHRYRPFRVPGMWRISRRTMQPSDTPSSTRSRYRKQPLLLMCSWLSISAVSRVR